ncbi:hypothetical protein E3N88_19331 [Mikania micrantha]|uniref:Uncharacterized protein n=1 Tax=Mikania micrantha TaxID=192012 RepID=A0A5N6NQ97_9ASTR|nr:hypothetical protein E3N88_19331 [Mikania micrantha]
MLAAPFVFDLENLPLENPDNGQEGRQALIWVKARAQVLRGEKTNTLRKEEVTLRKQHCFRRITYSYQKVYKTTASEGLTLSRFKALENLVLLKNKSFRRHSSADKDFRKYSLIKDCS